MPMAAAAVATPGIMSIMDFQYVACGNEQWNGGVNPSCDHGPAECFGNMAEECVRNATAYNPVAYMPFMECLEGGRSPQTQAKVDSCASKHNIDSAKINACTSGPLGKVLMGQAFHDTPAVVARMGVPLFLGPDNKVLNPNSTADIIKVACAFWTGKKPSFCNQNHNVTV